MCPWMKQKGDTAALEQVRLAREATERAIKKTDDAASEAAAAAAGAGLEAGRKASEGRIRRLTENAGYGAFMFRPNDAPPTSYRELFGA